MSARIEAVNWESLTRLRNVLLLLRGNQKAVITLSFRTNILSWAAVAAQISKMLLPTANGTSTKLASTLPEGVIVRASTPLLLKPTMRIEIFTGCLASPGTRTPPNKPKSMLKN